MYFPQEALRGNIKKNPWKYWLARKISEHKRMNIGKPNEDTISVQTLIDACPNYPTYEKVMSEDRAIRRRIIEPFERDLDAQPVYFMGISRPNRKPAKLSRVYSEYCCTLERIPDTRQ